MNQREATVTVIEYIRDREADAGLPKPVSKALKVLEKRAETLRLRHARRFVPIPADLADEPLTLTLHLVIDDLRGTICRVCQHKKETRASFCTGCYIELSHRDAGTAKALWRGVNDDYGHAYCRALRVLGLILPTPKQVQQLISSYQQMIPSYQSSQTAE